MVKLILCGCLGRMGTAICNMAAATPDMEIVAGVDTVKPAQSCSYPVYTNINDTAVHADVIISYLPPNAEDNDKRALLDYGIKHNVPLVICTTGLTPEEEVEIVEAAKNVAVFYSKNMSFGVNVLTHIIKSVSKLLYDSNFDIEIIEKHHNKKIDAPSGTAVMLVDNIKDAVDAGLTTATGRNNTLTARSRNEIGVSAIRGGNIIGEHSILFAGQNETIEITHTAGSRDVFAEGTLKAAKFIFGKPPGLYNMEDLILELQ